MSEAAALWRRGESCSTQEQSIDLLIDSLVRMPGHKSISTRCVWGGGKAEIIREEERKVGCGSQRRWGMGCLPKHQLEENSVLPWEREGRLKFLSKQAALQTFPRADLCRLEGSCPGERLPLEAL